MIEQLVSVVIPTYNRREFVCETVDSVLAQPHQNLEVIVVDDGSTDGTGELIREKYRNEPRVRYVWQENSERAVARNTGIKAAKGDFIGFLDSDDLWRPTKIQKQLEILTGDPAVVMVYCGLSHCDEKGQVLQNMESALDGIHGNIFLDLVYCNRIGSPTTLVRRSVFDRCGLFTLNPRLICFEDWEMWTRIAYYGKVAYVPERLAIHRLHSANTESPVTAPVYAAFVSGIVRMIKREDVMAVRTAASERFCDLVRDAFRRHEITENRIALIYGVRCLGLRFLRRFRTERWMAANVLLGSGLARMLLSIYKMRRIYR